MSSTVTVRSARPDLVERYDELYRRGAYAPGEERKRLAGLVRMPGATSGFGRWSGASAGSSEAAGDAHAHQESLF